MLSTYRSSSRAIFGRGHDPSAANRRSCPRHGSRATRRTGVSGPESGSGRRVRRALPRGGRRSPRRSAATRPPPSRTAPLGGLPLSSCESRYSNGERRSGATRSTFGRSATIRRVRSAAPVSAAAPRSRILTLLIHDLQTCPACYPLRAVATDPMARTLCSGFDPLTARRPSLARGTASDRIHAETRAVSLYCYGQPAAILARAATASFIRLRSPRMSLPSCPQDQGVMPRIEHREVWRAHVDATNCVRPSYPATPSGLNQFRQDQTPSPAPTPTSPNSGDKECPQNAAAPIPLRRPLRQFARPARVGGARSVPRKGGIVRNQSKAPMINSYGRWAAPYTERRWRKMIIASRPICAGVGALAGIAYHH